MMVTNTASEDRTGTEERKTDSDSSLILLVVLQASYLDLVEMIVMMDHSRLTHLLGDALALETGGSCFEQIWEETMVGIVLGDERQADTDMDYGFPRQRQ